MKLATIDEVPRLALPPSLTVRAVTRDVACGAGKPSALLRELILLAGMLRPTPFSAAVGRRMYELPVSDGCSILDLWCESARALARRVGHNVSVRILAGSGSTALARPRVRGGVRLTIEPDRSPFRGTGGALRDAVGNVSREATVLVASAAQLMVQPLDEQVLALANLPGELALVAHEDGQPVSLLLARTDAIALLPPVGFIDLKEQALRIIARSCDVRVLRRRRPGGLIVRTLDDYVTALRSYHKTRRLGAPTLDDPVERSRPEFRVLEPGAAVHPSAQLYDSVVLDGGRVESGAMLVRSVVCPGALVPRDAVVVDQVVTRLPRRSSWRPW